jgi:hypothetical protein
LHQRNGFAPQGVLQAVADKSGTSRPTLHRQLADALEQPCAAADELGSVRGACTTSTSGIR